MILYLSLQAEWMSSQMDVRRTRAPDEREELEGLNEEEEGVSLPANQTFWSSHIENKLAPNTGISMEKKAEVTCSMTPR